MLRCRARIFGNVHTMRATRMRPWLGAVLVGLAIGSCRAQPGPDGLLPPCPSTPNCVSSETDPADRLHFVPPLPLPDGLDPIAALDAFEAILRSEPRTEVIDRTPLRLRATDRTRWLRFVDDVEARVDVEARLLHVRSASRVGAGDMGANRRRVEAWLGAVAKAWGVAWHAPR